MSACATMMEEIDRRIEYIASQVSLGTPQEDVVSEQYQELLNQFSKLRGVTHAGITTISNHLLEQNVFSREQLLAFSGCLRAVAADTEKK